MILPIVWNSDIRLHNASNVRAERVSRFRLCTTQILGHFIQQNIVREPQLLYQNICFTIFITFPLQNILT